jgi:uroporphyrinogen-III synthase
MRSLNKQLFISKNDSEIDPFRSQFEELGFEVEGHSFLSFLPVEFEVSHSYDVIFFGSPRAVIFFKTGFYSLSGDVKIACIGEKTAELLESLGYVVSFRGESSGEPGGVAEEFKDWLTSAPLSPKGSRRVLFPISDRSLKTVSRLIDEEQKEEVVVYSTDVGAKLVGVIDVYVFTSPSNVEGFFIDNVIPLGSEVIAWGKSTETTLISRGSAVNYCLTNSSFEELIEYLS